MGKYTTLQWFLIIITLGLILHLFPSWKHQDETREVHANTVKNSKYASKYEKKKDKKKLKKEKNSKKKNKKLQSKMK